MLSTGILPHVNCSQKRCQAYYLSHSGLSHTLLALTSVDKIIFVRLHRMHGVHYGDAAYCYR